MRLACGRLYSFSDTRLLDCVSRTTLLAKKTGSGRPEPVEVFTTNRAGGDARQRRFRF
jgi:hypothetical protein